ncbi:MAG: uracil-DNA glycosylase family protein [Kofleriaceae bacterium]
MARRKVTLPLLLDEIRACRICEDELPHGPRPIVVASATAPILLAGQAPGARVHASGVAWDDPSGDRLRGWLAIDRATFYDPARLAIVPMGFCYPGTSSSGDLPPRHECREAWHARLLPLLTGVRLTIVIGQYAQDYHLGDRQKANLTETVRAFAEYLPAMCVVPHPSPRNARWLAKNRWFERDCVPQLRSAVRRALEPSMARR